MPSRFLIEIPHDPGPVACAKAVEIVITTGSHLLTHADWGCRDGVHKAWIIVEVDSKDEARAIVPPVLRPLANIVQLNTFKMSEIDHILRGQQA